MVPPVSSRPKHKAAAAQALLPHQQVRLRVAGELSNSLNPSIHEKETPCVPPRGGGTQGVSALKPERYLGTPQVLESLVYEKAWLP